MTVRTVTPQLEWEIQVCDNALGAYSKYSSFKDEEMANLIELGEK